MSVVMLKVRAENISTFCIKNSVFDYRILGKICVNLYLYNKKSNIMVSDEILFLFITFYACV